jgi:hypothetical protein
VTGDRLFVVLYFPVAMFFAVLGELGDAVLGRERMRRWGLRP